MFESNDGDVFFVLWNGMVVFLSWYWGVVGVWCFRRINLRVVFIGDW